MPRVRPALPLLAVAALIMAGCGGGEVEFEQITAPPPALTIPEDSGSTAAAAAPSDDAEDTPTPTPTPDDGTATAPPADPGTTTTTPPADPGATGGTTPPAQEPQQEEPDNTGGATADEGLDQFCADNPGACEGGATP